MSALLVNAGESGPKRLTSQLISTMPAFVVPDVQAAAEHYRDKLGFRLAWVLGKHPAQFGIVELAQGQGLHLKSVPPSCAGDDAPRSARGAQPAGDSQPARSAQAAGGAHPVTGRQPARGPGGALGGSGCDVYVRISDADARHADLVRRGARVLSAPTDKPHAQREFEVMDADGFVLCFGADLTGQWPAGSVATAPEFAVPDVDATARCYRERLGFEVRTWGTPALYAIAQRDDVRIHLARAAHAAPPTSNAPAELWDAYVEVFGVRALHDELLARGADLVGPPQLTEYGNLEMRVRDLDGHVLCFAVLRDDVARGEG